MNAKHGHKIGGVGSPTYDTWRGMRSRCSNPNDGGWEAYGGRGITVCDRWADFRNFLADMGERPSRDHEIDRKDNDGNYEPGNCRWATNKRNARNRRNNRQVLTPRGVMLLCEAAEVFGVDYGTLHWRLARRWPPERAFARPGVNPRQGCLDL